MPAGFRHPAAHAAFEEAILRQPAQAVCLSVGGGPTLIHPCLINLNIAPMPNVRVVGTAYLLPFADSSVDAVYCEAVLEHLEDPRCAVSEIFRVLKPGGQVFAATPFLQPFHGYPNHYQNFTLNGHRRLFESAGFVVISSGACNGPAFALVDLLSNFIREYVPTKPLSRLGYYALRILGSPFALLDRFLLRSPTAHQLASSTFVHCRKSTTAAAAA